MNEFIDIFKDPKKEIFWTSTATILTLSTVIGTLFNFLFSNLRNNIINSKTGAILNGQVELYLNWVKVSSSSQKNNDDNVLQWLSSEGGGINLGRNYTLYKSFIKRLNKQERSSIHIIPKDKFKKIIQDYDSAPKWSRFEI